MDLTIVIVSFKSGEILDKCIKSIDNKYQIIVVENSLDHSLKSKLEKSHLNVNCVIPEKNLGYGAGNNLGIKLAKSKYVLILNPDTILLHNTIEKLNQATKKIKDFAILGPKIYGENDNERQDYKSVEYIKGFAILFNKEKFTKIGYFDEKYFLYFEEIDLCRKIIKSGFKIYCINDALIKHEGGKSHERKYDFEMELSRNWHWMWSTFYYHKKNFGYLNGITKIYKNFFSSLIKIVIYFLIFNSEKRKIYLQRLSGIYNSIIGKPSWYRPKFRS